MISKIIWTLKADKTIEKVTKETNKLFANGVASTEYGLICDDIAENDVVFIIAKSGINEYAQRMKRQLITLEDGSTKMGWSVVSNGIELNFALPIGPVPITFSFKIERFSELDATTLVSRYTTQADTALCYYGSAYVPEVEPTDAEQIIEDLVGLENRVLDIETNIGDLDDLATENKDNLVEAINEVDGLAKQNKSDIEDIEEKIEDIDGLKTNKLDKSVTENGVTSTFDRYNDNRPYISIHDSNNDTGVELRTYSSGSQEPRGAVEQFQIYADKATENNQYKYSWLFVSPTEIRLKNDQDVVGRTKELKITDQKVTINNKEVATETEIDNVQNGVDQNSYDIGQLASQIVDLQNITPSQATSTNQLADKDFVNSSINSIAAFPITKNAQREHFATKQELDNATTFYSGGVVRVPTKNDYTIVDRDETHNNAQTKYIYNNGWEYWTTINLKPFTEAQQKAIDSGITAELVEQIQQGGSQPASETVLGTVRFWADADGTLRMSTLPYVPTLETPNLTLNGDILEIEDVPNAESYDIYVDGEFVTNVERGNE